jgi:DNA-binding CsgD family transcriptional regulator/predicted ATPase
VDAVGTSSDIASPGFEWGPTPSGARDYDRWVATRLLEREVELSELLGALEAASRGEGRFVLVGGEAGAGKTSLIQELRRRVDSVFAACEPLSVPAPLAPVRELAPGLAELDGDDRVALARALRAALLVNRQAAVVEDAHWADPATLDVLRALARRIDEAGVLVVVTYRDDELRANAALSAFVGDLATAPAVRRIDLRPLSVEAVRVLVEPSGGDPVEVMRLTNGNPFLVAEVIAARELLPATVRDATLARVIRLDDASRAVVEAAAVIGQRVPFAVLREIEPFEPAALAGALARGVLVDEGSDLVFRHELTRQAIEESIPLPRAAALHAKALVALEGTDPARLAHHAERAGLREEAGRFAERAAAEAEHVGALQEASLQLKRALLAPAGTSERFELLLRYARATNFAGDMEQAYTAAEEAVGLARADLGSAVAEGRALVVLSWTLWSLDRVEEARSAADDAVAALAVGRDAEYAAALAARLRMESIAFDPWMVVAQAPRALALAQQVGSEEARVDIATSLGLAQGHLGDAAALPTILGALADAKAARLTFQTIRGYVNAVDIAVELRAHTTVDALADEAMRRLDTFGTAIPLQQVQLSVARSLLDRGRLDEAVEWAQRSRRDDHGGIPLALGIEAVVRARRGEDADTLFEQAWRPLEGIPDGWRHGVLRAWEAEAAWLRGDLGAIRDSGTEHGRSAADIAAWAARARGSFATDWRSEQARWRELHAPYEAALAALPADERTARQAVGALRRLGADGAASAFARERRRLGFGSSRGPRATTLANPAGLTRREQELLDHMARGATNPEIARALQLSGRTVAHHVSSILAKLDARTRTGAVEAARTLGLVQDGPPPDTT